MELDIWKGTINGYDYMSPVLLAGAALSIGYCLYWAKGSEYEDARYLHEHGRIKEKPTFWNSGRLIKEWEDSDDPNPEERARIEFGKAWMRKYFW